MGIRFDAFLGETAELLADHFKFVVETGFAKADVGGAFPHDLDKACTGSLRVAILGQSHDTRCHHAALVVLCQTKVLQANDLSLAHRDAAVELPEVLAKRDLKDQLFKLAKLIFGL